MHSHITCTIKSIEQWINAHMLVINSLSSLLYRSGSCFLRKGAPPPPQWLSLTISVNFIKTLPINMSTGQPFLENHSLRFPFQVTIDCVEVTKIITELVFNLFTCVLFFYSCVDFLTLKPDHSQSMRWFSGLRHLLPIPRPKFYPRDPHVERKESTSTSCSLLPHILHIVFCMLQHM